MRFPDPKTGSSQWLCLELAGETLHLGHFFCLGTLWTLSHFELNFLALLQGLEAIALNGAVVNEDV